MPYLRFHAYRGVKHILGCQTHIVVFLLYFLASCGPYAANFSELKAKTKLDNFAIFLYCFMVDMHCLYINKC